MKEVGNKNGKKIFKIPVSYSVSGHILVQANSLRDAIKWCVTHPDQVPLAEDAEYLDDSYLIGDLSDKTSSVDEIVDNIMEFGYDEYDV